jgi:PIN domain nuclease of toxin-antitoxin system
MAGHFAVNLLLDTCAAIHLAQGTLPRHSIQAMSRAHRVHVSTAAAWEVAMKASAGKLSLAVPISEWFETLCARHSLSPLDLDLKTLLASCELPPIHRDPFDRVLVATALSLQVPIMTCDRIIASYPGIRVIWDSE